MEKSIYRVKTAGHSEQCLSYNQARQAFERLHQKMKRKKEAFKITLQLKGADGKWETLDSVDVKE